MLLSSVSVFSSILSSIACSVSVLTVSKFCSTFVSLTCSLVIVSGAEIPSPSYFFASSAFLFSILLKAFWTALSRSNWVHNPTDTGSTGVRFAEFQCVLSLIDWIVDFVVQKS